MTARSDAAGVFRSCLAAFQAFAGLYDLGEDLRILSLNAELTAGRAGKDGNTVRVLTQYTRELVYRLMRIEHEMAQAQHRTNALSAQTLKRFARLGMLERAAALVPNHGAGAAVIDAAQIRLGERIRSELEAVETSVTRLGALAQQVTAIAEQAETIATSIAIETARIGGDFDAVTDSMRHCAGRLRAMIGHAEGAVDEATARGRRLGVRARTGFVAGLAA